MFHCLFPTYIKSAKAVAFLWHQQSLTLDKNCLVVASLFVPLLLFIIIMSDFVQSFPIFIFDWVVYAFNLFGCVWGRE